MRNGVQLITYADRFGGGDLAVIAALVNGPFDGVFTGVHILPFYLPFDGIDAGFDPVDHRVVDSHLGTWEDIAYLAGTHDVMADVIVNHISDESPQFRDFVTHGDDCPYTGMFLERETIFPGGPTHDELSAIYRPRPGDPFTGIDMADGSQRTMWTTFSPHQIDLNLRDVGAASYLDEVLDRLMAAGVSQVRLDAVGYSIKTRGTSCFMTDDTVAFIDVLCDEIGERKMTSLLEIHSHHLDQIGIAARVDMVYDFALPPLILHALRTGSSVELRSWLEISPRNAYTVLDTHDGIGVIDVGPDSDGPGLLSKEQIDELVEGIHEATGGESQLATGEAASNLDLYQVNTTYYSALGADDNNYLLARLVQFLSPGIPQVYYAGLFAVRNDMDLLARTGVGRDINRPYLSPDDIEDALGRPVVQHLLDLCCFRNSHPAFQGDYELREGDPSELNVTWINATASINATINFRDKTFEMRCTTDDHMEVITEWSGFHRSSQKS
jgi:sucrose phosphorylase